MEARLLLSGGEDTADELYSLRQWLAGEDEFRGRVKLEQAPIQPGHMGAITDVLQVALSNEGALTVLAGSVAVWLRQRRSKLTVKIVNPDGSSTEITASGPVTKTLVEDADPPKHG